ncbi:MAG TPA: histidine kinase, partial [Pseudomonas sp.]|nr:histidine kinase [Pseudomonas sp.]
MGAPYAEYDQRQRRLSGFHVQLMEQLAAELGVRLQWRRFSDEAALQEAALEGRIDVAPGLRQTPAGLRLWRYSDPFLRIPRLIVGDRGGPRAVDLEYLHPSELVAAAGPGPVSEFLASNYPNITVLTAASQADALRQ